MITTKYAYRKKSLTEFEFESHGPKGVIKKCIAYTKTYLSFNGSPVYDLGFGDYNEVTHAIDDEVTSNNQDKMKILGTVASTVMDFASGFDRVAIHARGSTPARTRLYQMGLNAYKKEIALLFTISGFKNNKWNNFEEGVNYEEFVVIKKIIEPIKKRNMSEIPKRNKKKTIYDPSQVRPPCKPGENPLDCHFRWSIGLYAQHPVPEEYAQEVTERVRLEKLANLGK
jgi:hypothetical protein